MDFAALNHADNKEGLSPGYSTVLAPIAVFAAWTMGLDRCLPHDFNLAASAVREPQFPACPPVLPNFLLAFPNFRRTNLWYV
jgi:hypothetical protein